MDLVTQSLWKERRVIAQGSGLIMKKNVKEIEVWQVYCVSSEFWYNLEEEFVFSIWIRSVHSQFSKCFFLLNCKDYPKFENWKIKKAFFHGDIYLCLIFMSSLLQAF